MLTMLNAKARHLANIIPVESEEIYISYSQMNTIFTDEGKQCLGYWVNFINVNIANLPAS